MQDEPTKKTPVYAEDAPADNLARPRGRNLARVINTVLIAGLLTVLGLILLLTVVSRDLPTIESLKDYRPKQATVLYSSKGEIAARFATERRTVVPFERIPKLMVDAVLAAEDADFFKHKGLDYLGIFRCAVLSLLKGRTVCGGSTVTQQMVKTFLLSPERNLLRKIREAILTKRVEESLSKDEILHLYLNQIYFGHGAYGVQEASRVYFSKNVEHLNLAQAGLLAGLPQRPSSLDPYRYPERARKRRRYVLGQMLKLNKISQAEHDDAEHGPIEVDWKAGENHLDSNNHYAAHVRELLKQKLGSDVHVNDGGFRVYTGIDPVLQTSAEQAIRNGLRALDKRQGWRGPLFKLEPNQVKSFLKLLNTRLSTVAPSISRIKEDSNLFQPIIWDLSKLKVKPDADWLDIDRLVSQTRFRRFQYDQIYGGLVVEVNDAQRVAMVDLGGPVRVRLPLRSGMNWARPFNTFRATTRPKRPSDVLSVGDVVLVRAVPSKKKNKSPNILRGKLEQAPKAQATLVAMNPLTREIRALVGGFGIGAGTFNRATQAKRQAGSTFKPLLYSAAFETGDYNTISPCQDAPRVYRDQWTGKSWKPKNYDGKFDGIITLRKALTKSKNLCSVELIDKVGVDKVIDTARRMGITSPLPRSLTLGLGSGDVSPLEMVNAYATLAAGGRMAEPIFIRKIVDTRNKVIYETASSAKQTIAASVAYQVTSLMQSVVESGTARRVKKLGRPVAGKTGTTNEARNAWFIGFTPDLVVGVWVGFDDNSPLGRTETGGRAAIPIWLEFMTAATMNTPIRDFAAPEGIVFAFVDPESGKLADPNRAGGSYEPFLSGKEPNELLTEAKPPVNFGMDDLE
jgi:penicillin-binding protein 1A